MLCININRSPDGGSGESGLRAIIDVAIVAGTVVATITVIIFVISTTTTTIAVVVAVVVAAVIVTNIHKDAVEHSVQVVPHREQVVTNQNSDKQTRANRRKEHETLSQCGAYWKHDIARREKGDDNHAEYKEH